MKVYAYTTTKTECHGHGDFREVTSLLLKYGIYSSKEKAREGVSHIEEIFRPKNLSSFELDAGADEEEECEEGESITGIQGYYSKALEEALENLANEIEEVNKDAD